MRTRVLVSAHRGGAGSDVARENTLAAVLDAVALGADAVELDVSAEPDGTLVLGHDDAAMAGAAGAGRRTTLDEALEALGDRALGHIDLKTSGAGAVRAAQRCWQVLGPERVVLTTGHVPTAAALRAAAVEAGHPRALVGLSLGHWPSGRVGPRGLVRAVRRLVAEAFPERRLAACGANAVVAQRRLARARLARVARRAGLPLLVWTVDSPRELGHWLAPGRAWMVTTNHPRVALELRGG